MLRCGQPAVLDREAGHPGAVPSNLGPRIKWAPLRVARRWLGAPTACSHVPAVAFAPSWFQAWPLMPWAPTPCPDSARWCAFWIRPSPVWQ